MDTERKIGVSLQKGIKKLVNGYRVKEIRQWVQSERNSSMGTEQINI